MPDTGERMMDPVEVMARAMKARVEKPLMNIPTLSNVLAGSLGDAWPYIVQAGLDALTAAGYAIVPVEPTEEMIAAGGEIIADNARDAHERWTSAAEIARQALVAMLAASSQRK